jgi:mono/diheme cytochrome c family protein
MSAGLGQQLDVARSEDVPPPPAPPIAPVRSWLARSQAAFILSLPVLLLALSVSAARLAHPHLKVAETPTATVAVGEPNGTQLYLQNCARCHGERGDGHGIDHVEPPARYFGGEKFKLATTINGMPTDDDLLRIIRCGIPGTAMPSFTELSEEQLRAIIGHVRRLTWNGLYETIKRKKEQSIDDEFSPATTTTQLASLTRPGKTLEVPLPFTAPTPESLARGHKIYTTACISCHGPKGHGDGPQVKDLKNENGTHARPRDLTRGLFKCGGEPAGLYTRIRLGIPGTPMPATTTISPAETKDLVNYVLSLSRQPDTPAASPDGRVTLK